MVKKIKTIQRQDQNTYYISVQGYQLSVIIL